MDKKNQETQMIKAFKATGFVWEILISIALPTTVFALFGRWVDRRLQTTPLFIIMGLIVALTIAFTLVQRKAKQFLKENSQPQP